MGAKEYKEAAERLKRDIAIEDASLIYSRFDTADVRELATDLIPLSCTLYF